MKEVYLLLTHLFILGTLLSLGWLTIKIVRDARTTKYRYLRLLSISLGLLIFLGAKATLDDVPNLLLAGIETISPVRLPLLGHLLPLSAGALAAWFLIRSLKGGSGERLTYMLLMSGAFLLSIFYDLYAIGLFQSTPTVMDESLGANLSFTIGIGVYVVFVMNHDGEVRSDEPSTWRNQV